MSDMLAGTVKLPGVGTVKKKYVYAGVGVTVVLITITLVRRKKAGATAAAGSYTDGAGNVCAAPNPATGFCPGSVEDTAALAQSSQISGDLSSSGSGSGDTGGQVGTEVQNGPPFSSNAAWAQYATTYLVDQTGRDSKAVSDALGAYLNGVAVDTAGEDIINVATAYAGTPPVSGPAGFPPSIRHQGTKTGGKTNAVNPVTGITFTAVTATSATVSWDASKDAASYTYVLHAGSTTAKSGKPTGTTVKLSGLRPGTKYLFEITARPAASGVRPASGTFTTKKTLPKPADASGPMTGPASGVKPGV